MKNWILKESVERLKEGIGSVVWVSVFEIDIRLQLRRGTLQPPGHLAVWVQ